MNTADLNKTSLRALCRTHGITGYGTMTTAAMSAALEALDSDAVDTLYDAVADSAPTLRAAAPSATISMNPAATSVRAWLEARFAEGTLSVAEAKLFVESTGRSPVTMYRQAKELGYQARKGEFRKTLIV